MTPETKKAVDLYGRYFAFWVVALLFAIVFWVLMVAVLPWDRQLTSLEQLLAFVGALAPMPLSALTFVFFRRGVRRKIGYSDD